MGRTAARQRAAVVVTTALAVVTIAVLAVGSDPAHALASPTPWDGANPFRCTIQDAGQGTTLSDPGADPLCVRYDKTNQNVTGLGLVDFLTKEPARFDAAGPKCFYYQEDHWRGSLIQSDGQTVLYEFYGHYFFNKATGDGGVWVTGFTVAGQTFDPRTLPGFPPQYDQYYGPGTGGFITHNDVPTDPACTAQASESPGSIYARGGSSCLRAHGHVGRTYLGPVNLGMSEGHVEARFGTPSSARRGFLRYCLISGGNLLVGARPHRGAASGVDGRARALILIATGRSFSLRGHGRTIRVGASWRSLRRAFPRLLRIARIGRTAVFAITPFGRPNRPARSAGTIIAGIVGGHVAYLGTFDQRAIPSRGALAGYLRRAR